MSAKPVADPPAHVSLSEHLPGVTEALATARTPEDVFGVVLKPALKALNALAGAALLVSETGERLEIAARQGNEPGPPSLWQDGPLDGNVPAGDALRRREALFFERAGDLVRAYPGLEARPGGVVAAAVLPMFLDDRPLGTLILGFQEPHEFTDEEQHFLRTLASQCALALGRARLLESVRHEARQRTDILESISDAFYAVDHAWRFTYVNRKAEQWWGRRREDLIGRVYWEEFPQAVGSAPYHAHFEAMRERRVVRLESRSPILDHWVDISIYPTGDGVSVYFKDISERKRQEQELRGLNADLEARVEERTRRIEADARAHEAFVAFTEAVGTETDLLALARQAITTLRAQFPDGSVVYYEPQGDLWKLRAWSEDLGEDFIALLTAGVPGSTSFIASTLRARQPVFTTALDPEQQQVDRHEVYGTAAHTPVLVGGEVRAILGLGIRESRQWQARDQAVFRAVGRSLELALERAEQTQRLAEQNAQLGARTRALEAFEEWSHDLTLDAEPEVLIERAEELLLDLLPVQAALHYEREGERWYVRSMQGEYGSEGLRLAHEAGLPHDTTDNLRLPFETGETYYQDAYNPATDGLADHMAHVSATAIVPLRTGRGVRGLIGLGRFGQSNWTETERTVIETVRRSLELALDRAQGAAQLAEERRKLEVVNEELEAFAYSVSHDLRTPVRHIGSFNDLLRRQLGESLDAKAARYLGIVGEAAGRMNTLIDAMLDLSRTSRVPLQMGLVDLGELVRTVQAELEADEPERHVEWLVAPLPLVRGDPHTLRQVMLNLLSNALKYTRGRKVTRIEVWTEDRPQEWAIFVRDNGVGFDSRYADKLFGVFQRLHRQEEFEGTGVGLANVRRIVARHGGQVWAEGRLGEGATFGFTLPGPR